jgi:hypothetical protein
MFAEAFGSMGLKTVYGECYRCNPSYAFWEKVVEEYGGYSTVLKARKYWGGVYWDSLYFSVDRSCVY